MARSFKAEFLNMLEELKKLALPQGGWAICGSGPLAIRDLRRAQDLDVVVKNRLWIELLSKFPSYDGKHIRIGNIEIWGDLINLTWRLEEVIDNGDIIEGFRFVSLKDTLEWKQFLNREKDRSDILMIRELLKKKKR